MPRARDYGAAIKGGLLALAGYAILDSGVRPGSFASTIVVIMAGVILLAVGYTYAAPLLLGLVVDTVRYLSARARPAAPPLALENIARNPRRYRGTIAALMAAFAMVLIVGSFVRSLRGSILSWLDQTLSAEFYVCAGPHLPLPSGPTIDGAVEPDLRALPGVADVSASRLINVRVGDTVAILRSVSVGGLERHRYPVVEGDMGATVATFAQGDTVLVSDNFAYRHGFHAGDSLTLSTPSGERTFRIAAVVLDYTLDIGTILIERETYVRLWRDELVNGFLVWLVPGTDAESARAAISRLLGSRFDTTIFTAREFNAQLADVLDRALLLTYAIQIVAITIAVIGVVNFFLAEVLDRAREIGLLRSVALTRRQLRRTISAEAMILGAFGGVMAALYAWPVSRLLVTRSTRVVSGWALGFDFPVGLALVTVAIAALTSVAAAYYPAHRAAGRRVADLVLVES
jgi:putative ABC transport system permease protein